MHNIFTVLKNRNKEQGSLFTDDAIRRRIQFLGVYIVLGVTAFGMTVMNALTGWVNLGKLTLFFGIANVLNLVLCAFGEKAERVTHVLFAMEAIVLFSGFAILGEPEGFSILWTVFLAALGGLLYGNRYGILVSMIQWAILAFLFWTPSGRSLLGYAYPESFLERFPILYLALLCLGTLFEYIRKTTQRELVALRKKFETLYDHDALTGLFNRYGFDTAVRENYEKSPEGRMAFAILDLDDFKKVNDTYGHIQGDEVLKTIANLLEETVGEKGIVCRWGGEEFSLLLYDGATAEKLVAEILEKSKNTEYLFTNNSFCVTLSAGMVDFSALLLNDTNRIILQADSNLYQSKAEGKDRITRSSMN